MNRLDRKRLHAHALDRYLRVTERRNRDGSTVAYYGLAENVWNAATRRAEARVVHSFGRADKLDREALKRLVKSINRVLGAEEPDREAASDRIAIVFTQGTYSRGLATETKRRLNELGVEEAAFVGVDPATPDWGALAERLGEEGVEK